MKKCLTETFKFGTMKIFVEDKIESVCPSFVGACVEADVENSEYSEELWQLIDADDRIVERHQRHCCHTPRL